ncbi:glucose-6-phosphate dehydrogenase [Microbacterium sp. cx-55]|uniref:glucose-6-phosphate dehydrogenase n=1 Tax=Microbacterium sp. cx-55 TaxID=2875948 RepID=UPI001CBF8801|nr:glucose-6-phosphate dehydrogenase [Microbacterium sp. cx-55]MBZ4487975.1 glucose-6-phosphate dehydrogenase [Microbacterium sp. cx-55]UGB34617.1 glucose-6-phosphate dehydrogenase [Microbacterium sp. cx-55]
MKIVASADWRDAIPFETPLVADTVAPGEATRCATCGVLSEPLPRDELWAVKHRHPNNHAGFVRFYCAEHVPEISQPESAPVAATKRASTPRAPRSASPRAAAARRVEAAPERPRAVCPDCFMEVSATGLCGNCGAQVT